MHIFKWSTLLRIQIVYLLGRYIFHFHAISLRIWNNIAAEFWLLSINRTEHDLAIESPFLHALPSTVGAWGCNVFASLPPTPSWMGLFPRSSCIWRRSWSAALLWDPHCISLDLQTTSCKRRCSWLYNLQTGYTTYKQLVQLVLIYTLLTVSLVWWQSTKPLTPSILICICLIGCELIRQESPAEISTGRDLPQTNLPWNQYWKRPPSDKPKALNIWYFALIRSTISI